MLTCPAACLPAHSCLAMGVKGVKDRQVHAVIDLMHCRAELLGLALAGRQIGVRLDRKAEGGGGGDRGGSRDGGYPRRDRHAIACWAPFPVPLHPHARASSV